MVSNNNNTIIMNRKYCLSFVLLLIVAAMAFSSCNKAPKEPQLTLSTDTLVFKGSETLTFSITTNNTDRREVYINCPDSWIYVSPQSGRIVEGETLDVRVTSYLDDPMSFKEGVLYITSAYDEKTVKLIGLPEDYTEYALPEKLFFPVNVDNVNMRINNYGNTTLDYSITASTSFVSFTPASGQVAMMQDADISVSIDRDNLFSEPNPVLYVTIDDIVDTVLLIPERKLMLDNNVIDAEYSKATDLLVYVGADATLNIYYPEAKNIETVALSYVPTCVSVSPDGTKAAVGHDAHVTYVDLLTKEILTTNNVSCDALDIVLTDNGWVYVFPRRDQWEQIRCMNVTTNNAIESLHTGNHSIYAGTRGKLHPSGKYIYGANNGLSPSDIEKYDIQNGTASYLYDSPYHGDYAMGGDLWFEENGNRLFTRAGTVFQTSETESSDMLYNGRINFEDSSSGSIRILSLDQLDLKRELYFVTSADYWYSDDPNPPFVYVYNSDNLTFKTKIRLEDYSVASGTSYSVYDAIPYYVFANSNGAELYVITKANGSGMIHEWAIQTIDMD